MSIRRQISTLSLLISLAIPSAFADWPSWRGSDDLGSIATGQFPSELNETALIWKTPLPGKGCSTPIISEGTIYVTAPVDGSDSLHALRDRDGKVLWSATFGPEVAGKHRNGSGNNSSPVTDGDAVYVYFKSGTLAAVELDGTIRWQTNLVERYGKDNLFWDHGTSPVLTKSDVVIARMHNGESWLAAFDKKTGELSWKVARNYKTPVECDHGYSTPLILDRDGKQVLLVWGAEHLTMHDAKDGSLLWTCGDFNPEGNKLWPSIAMPVIVDDMAVIAYGRNDRKIPRLYGVRLSGENDVTETNHAWLRDDISTFVPSPVAFDGNVYLVRDRGEVECIAPANGETIWSNRLPKSRSSYYASPMIANGILVAPREDGVVFIADIRGDQWKLLSENDMGEPVIGSPVPHGNRLLIRGEKNLFCFGNPESKN